MRFDQPIRPDRRPGRHRRRRRHVHALTQNETYEFPYVLVCFFQNEGCGWEDGSFDVCLSTSLDWSTVIDHNDEYREDLVVESMVSL